MISLLDASNPNERDPRRFIDAANIPYVVLPTVGFKHAKLGDLATVVNLRNGKVAGAIVADESAPELKMGEGSIALANARGIDSNPRTGGIEHGIAYVVYPGSGNGNPRGSNDFPCTSRRRVETWGALPQLKTSLRWGAQCLI